MKVGAEAKPLAGSVGSPAVLYLHEFGSQVWHAFGSPPYQVGSSLYRKTWRDVDVRLILSDDEYGAQGFGPPESFYGSGKWVAMCLAFSALGQRMTGLPIDFQIQQQSWANRKFKGPRNCLGFVALRYAENRPLARTLDPQEGQRDE